MKLSMRPLRSRLFLTAGLLLAFCRLVSAAEIGHQPYLPKGCCGSAPPPGFYAVNINAYYSTDKYKDHRGKTLETDNEGSIAVAALSLVWMSEKKFFGANYGARLYVPYMDQYVKSKDSGVRDQDEGISDMAVTPLILSWRKPRYDVTAAFSFWTPNGDWQSDNGASVGKNFWTPMFSLGGTFYFDKEQSTSISVINHYGIPSQERDLDITPGHDLHVEYALSKRFGRFWRASLIGYAYWQLTNDHGSDVTWAADQHGRTFSNGVELTRSFAATGLTLSMRHAIEYGVRDGFEGRVTWLTLSRKF